MYTSKYLTFDFESLLKKVPVSKFPETVHKHHDVAVGNWIRRGTKGFIWTGDRELRPTYPNNDANICGPLGRGSWIPIDDPDDEFYGGFRWTGDGFPPDHCYELEDEDAVEIVKRTIKNTPAPLPRNDDGY